MDGIMNYVDVKQNGIDVVNPLDTEEFRRQGYMVIDFITNYFNNINNYPVCSQVEPGYLGRRLPHSAPFDPESMDTILKDIQNDIVPGISHWQSPTYFAYFPCNASTTSILGEALIAAINVPGFNWISSPAATELESHVMDWLADMISLPESFKFSGGTGGGVLLGTTCEAVLACVVAARHRALDNIGWENIGKLVVYASDQTHCSFQKAAQIAGIFPRNFRKIPAAKCTSYGMDPNAFHAAVQEDVKAGLVPLFLCATVGTTSTAAVDPIALLCHMANQYGIWVHIDAAYAGSVCICPEYRHYINGVEEATSFSFNAHKWFLTSLDCCCLWVKEPHALVNALSTSPEYLRNKATESQQVVDYKDWGITLSRRFRALKLWMVIRSNGVSNLQRHVRRHVEMARHFESLVAQDTTFEMVVPRCFSVVCFRVFPNALLNGPKKYVEEETVNEMNKEILESINASGKVYMTHTVVGGVYVMRFAVGGTLTELRHVDFAWEVIKEHAHATLTRRLDVSENADSTKQNCRWR